jgi:hypothetical protein
VPGAEEPWGGEEGSGGGGGEGRGGGGGDGRGGGGRALAERACEGLGEPGVDAVAVEPVGTGELAQGLAFGEVDQADGAEVAVVPILRLGA